MTWRPISASAAWLDRAADRAARLAGEAGRHAEGLLRGRRLRAAAAAE